MAKEVKGDKVYLFRWLFNKSAPQVQSAAFNDKLKVEPSRTLDQIDWQSSEFHLKLLSLYLKPRDAAKSPYWQFALAEETQKVVDQYINQKLLVPVSLKSKVEFCITIVSLKILLKERGLKLTGKKSELVERLIVADENTASRLFSEKNIVECALEVRPRVRQYIVDKQYEYDGMISTTLAALRAHDFETASRIIEGYESKQLKSVSSNPYQLSTPRRENAIDVEKLTEIFTLRPNILKTLDEREWEPLHVAVSLGYLLGCGYFRDALPSDFKGVSKFGVDITLRMMFSHINYVRQIKELHKSGVRQGSIEGLRSCRECARITGKVDELSKLPQLPYEKCTCILGCRCTLLSTINFDEL